MVRPRQRKKYSSFMIPKPLQLALLLPLAFGWMAPGLFLALFGLGLVGLALWWGRAVLALLLGD